jgi:hypothetical protein
MRNKVAICILFFLTTTSIVFAIGLRKNLKVIYCSNYYAKIINPDDYPGANEFEKLKNALIDVPPAGATIIVPPKVYEGSNIEIPSNVQIIGISGATFRLSNNATNPFIIIRTKNNIMIENILFDGNKENVFNLNSLLILIDHGSSNILIFNNTFTNFRNMAIATNYSKTNQDTNFVKIYNNSFYNGDGAAILLRGYYENGTFFLKFVDVYQNILNNLSTNGKIGVAFASEVNISENLISFSESPLSGNIVIRGCENILVVKNTIVYSKAIAGILIETSLLFPNKGVFIIEDNQVLNEIGRGFFITGNDGVEATIFLRKNLFRNNSGPDIEAIDVKAYVIGNIVDTPNDLLPSSWIVAYNNHFTSAESARLFIFSRAR